MLLIRRLSRRKSIPEVEAQVQKHQRGASSDLGRSRSRTPGPRKARAIGGRHVLPSSDLGLGLQSRYEEADLTTTVESDDSPRSCLPCVQKPKTTAAVSIEEEGRQRLESADLGGSLPPQLKGKLTTVSEVEFHDFQDVFK